MTTLVLASASPRRKELLARLGAAFEVRPTDVDETPRRAELSLIHISEPTRPLYISYAVFCLKK